MLNRIAVASITFAAALSTVPAFAQVAVMGEPRSGAVVSKSDVPDPARAVAEAAKAKLPSRTWKMLLNSPAPGYGAVYCVRDQGEVHFFVAHGKASSKEALLAAQALAQPHAITTRKIPPYICGSWKSGLTARP